MRLSRQYIQRVVQTALEEDAAFYDATTLATIGDSQVDASADLVDKQSGIIAGIAVAQETFETLDPNCVFSAEIEDGDAVEPGMLVCSVFGSAASILSAERTALNIMQRMSGIATLTSEFVAAVHDTKATIVDTRKTAPGLRLLDKYSVFVGGGGNHRMTLADCILIKDNHIATMKADGMSIGDVVRHARANAPFSLKIEIEVETVSDAIDAMDAGADIILLDNMTVQQMREVVKNRRAQALLEASGNVTLSTVRAVAETGVDIISVGELTHSPDALDISLDFKIAS